MNISEFSKKYSLTADTLRFYEDLKILIPQRSANKYRKYTDAHEQQIKLIIALKSIGFSLNEIKQFIDLDQRQTSEKCNLLSNQLIDEKLQHMNQQIELLILGRRALSHFQQCIQDNQYQKNQQEIQQMIDQLYTQATAHQD